MTDFMGSESQFRFVTPSLPRLRLAAAMLNDERSEKTRLRAAMTSDVCAVENGPKTLMEMIWAPLAIPDEVFDMGAGGGGTAFGALPAAMPATCVPWYLLLFAGSAELVPFEEFTPPGHPPPDTKHASETTLPARNGCDDSTPESMMATTHPVPSKPATHACGASMRGPLWKRSGRRGSSTRIRLTSRPEACSCANPAESISRATKGRLSYLWNIRAPVGRTLERIRAPALAMSCRWTPTAAWLPRNPSGTCCPAGSLSSTITRARPVFWIVERIR